MLNKTNIPRVFVFNDEEMKKNKLRNEKLEAESTISIIKLIEKSKKESLPQIIWRGITKGSFGFIFGPSKSGKTVLCENLAMKIACGSDEFMGEKLIGEPQKVLFVSLEEFWLNRALRNSKQISTLNGPSKGLIEGNYQSVPIDFLRYIDNREDWSRFYNLVKSSNADIVFVDSLTRLASNIEESEMAKKVTQRLRDITYGLGLTMVVIHHSTKLGDKPINRDSMAGSRVLAQEADFAIAVSRTQMNHRYIKNVFFRYADDYSETVTTFKIDDNLWLKKLNEVEEFKLFQEMDGRRDSSNADSILEYLKTKSCSTTGELEKEFVQTNTMGRKTLFNNLKKLVLNDVIINKKGNYCVRE